MFLVYYNDGKRTYAANHPSKHYVHPHSRKAWEFMFICSGQCIQLKRQNNVTTEELIVAPVLSVSGPDSVHGWTAKGNSSCSIIVFHFDEADYNLRHVLGRAENRCVKYPEKDTPYIRGLLDRCVQSRKQNNLFSLIIYHIVSLELTLYFLSLVPRTELSSGTDFGKSKVVEALAWYKANLAYAPNVEEVARAVHLSATHLRRLFHKVQGTSPQEAFTQAQFDRAKELMLDPTISLERISEHSGFGSASAFSRAFKNEFTISPKIYRAKLLTEQSLQGSSAPAGKGAKMSNG